MTLPTIFIAYPPAALAVRRRLLSAITAVIWAAYAWYETLTHTRVLCSGECNIRVDRLLIYPILLVLSGTALVSALRKKQD